MSIIGIGILTAFIGDFASHFGCTINLKDAITAIAFVALGTSVPGMPWWLALPRHSGLIPGTDFFLSFWFGGGRETLLDGTGIPLLRIIHTSSLEGKCHPAS